MSQLTLTCFKLLLFLLGSSTDINKSRNVAVTRGGMDLTKKILLGDNLTLFHNLNSLWTLRTQGTMGLKYSMTLVKSGYAPQDKSMWTQLNSTSHKFEWLTTQRRLKNFKVIDYVTTPHAGVGGAFSLETGKHKTDRKVSGVGGVGCFLCLGVDQV